MKAFLKIGGLQKAPLTLISESLKIALFLVFSSLLFAGCGEERENKFLSKIEVFDKSLIDTNQEYLYIPSTDQVSRTTQVGRPFFQGQEEIVKLKFEKDFLVAYVQETDPRFSDNPTNNKPAFRIPITHVDYREAKDPFGEGTNIEEKNEYIEWYKRRFFEPKPQSFEFSAVSTLPAEIDNIFGDSCSRKVGQSELSFEVQLDRIDIVIKRDFNTNYFCVNVNDLSDLAWSEVTHYSLVPLNKMISKDYETIVYDRDWERTFGFFDNKESKVDSSNNDTQDQEVYYMHRWNPNRETITYHLDPRFEKPENKNIKQATLLGIQRLNDGLATAGVKFRIQAVDGGPNLRPGDLNVSSIVLVEDPLAVGLLGYGPSVANPRTGEIVQARTVMYPGIMKKFIRRAYDELYKEELNVKRSAKAKTVTLTNSADASVLNSSEDALSSENLITLQAIKAGLENKLLAYKRNSNWNTFSGDLAKFNDLNQQGGVTSGGNVSGEIGNLSSSNIVNKWTDLMKYGAKALFNDTAFSLRTIFNGFKNKSDDEFDLDHLDAIEVLSKHNMTPARIEAFVDIKDEDLKKTILSLGKNRQWHQLDDTTRAEIVDIMLPFVWIPTLIHEIGHNLGLRHNFAGSEDEDNFYSDAELKSLGLESKYGSPYSSMMEYTKSEITGLRVPGKYDIAALRYGYLQKVELQDGAIVPVTAKPDELNLKNFEYCSDEGVSLNPNCNRFDEGVGYIEIANSIIGSYYENYKLVNFRSGRSNFSMMDDIMYASRVNQQFRSLRLMHERVTDIILDFDIPLSEIKEIEWLNEMNEGSKIAAQFLKNVVAEPDYSCVIFRDKKFNGVVRFSEIAGFSGAKKCADVPLNASFEVVGELGRRYNHEKFRDNPNIYLDQIDVRGVWMDKLLALRYLVARNLNEYSFDDHTLSYLDHPEIGSEINAFLKDLIIGDVVAATEITFNDGSTSNFEYAHNFSEGYQIKKPLTSFFHRSLKLPLDQLDLMAAAMHVTRSQLYKGLSSVSNDLMTESIEVYSEVPRDGRNISEFNLYKLGRTNYVAGPENEVANKIIARLKKIDLYETETRKSLIEVFTLLSQNQPLPTTATPNQAAIYKQGADDLYLYLMGDLPSKDYYSRILSVMTR